MKKYFLFSLLLIAFIGCTDKSDNSKTVTHSKRLPIVITAKVDTANATIGDVITYSLEVDREKEMSIDYSNVLLDIEGLPVSDKGSNKPKVVGNRIFESKWFKLRVDGVGSYIIPSFEINYEINKVSKSFNTNEIFIEIHSLLNDGMNNDIKGIRPLVGLKNNYLIVYVITFVLLLSTLLFYFLKRRKSKNDTPAKIISPYDEAVFALNTLKSKNLINEGRFKEFYFELSMIFRLFLERMLNFPALENTQDEILYALKKISTISTNDCNKISGLLAESDMIKFAKVIPDSFQSEAVFESVLTLVSEINEKFTSDYEHVEE